MADKEFVLRFLAFYLIGYESYEGDMDAFLNVAMHALNQLSQDDLDGAKVAFCRGLFVCRELLGDDAFRKPISDSGRRNPVSKALFDALAVSVSKLTQAEQDDLILKKTLFSTFYIELFQDKRLQKTLSEGTGKSKSVGYRFQKIEEVIRKTLG